MARRHQPPPSGERWAVVGASESGKGLWIKQRLRELRPARLLVWDYLSEYGEFARPCLSLGALALGVSRAGRGPFAYAYTARGRDTRTLRLEFTTFCATAWAAQDATVLVEELSRVTTPSWAPPEWAQLCNIGSHHRRLRVIGVSQFPAQIDKNLLGNATLIHTGPLRTKRHRVAVADDMDIDPAEIAALPRLSFIERDFNADPPTLTRGRVELPRGRPRQDRREAIATVTAPGAAPAGASPVTELVTGAPGPSPGRSPIRR